MSIQHLTNPGPSEEKLNLDVKNITSNSIASNFGAFTNTLTGGTMRFNNLIKSDNRFIVNASAPSVGISNILGVAMTTGQCQKVVSSDCNDNFKIKTYKYELKIVSGATQFVGFTIDLDTTSATDETVFMYKAYIDRATNNSIYSGTYVQNSNTRITSSFDYLSALPAGENGYIYIEFITRQSLIQ